MKFIKFLVLLILLTCINIAEAHACMCLTEDNVRLEQINSAEFIGIFRVVKSKPSEFKSDGLPLMNGMKTTIIESGTAYKIEPLVTYKGSISDKDTVYINHRNGCNPGAMRDGKIYRGLVVKNQYGVLIFPSTCTYVTREEWDNFEKKGRVTDKWISFEKKCQRQGKIIRFAGEVRCSKKTNDKGRVCKDGSECEGFCAVPHAEYEYSSEDLIASLNGESPKRPAVGKCSEWADTPDGMVVKNGYTQR